MLSQLFDLSRVPALVLAPLAELAALGRDEPGPAASEETCALQVLAWVAAIDRWGLPCLVTLPEPDLAPGLGRFVGLPVRVAPEGHALTDRGWVHLAAHATERDPDRVAVVLLARLEGTCANLRAALLEGRP